MMWYLRIPLLSTFALLLTACISVKDIEGGYTGLSAIQIQQDPQYISCEKSEIASLAEDNLDLGRLSYSAYKQGLAYVGSSQITTANSQYNNRVGAVAYAGKIGACVTYWGKYAYSHTERWTTYHSNETVVGMVPSGVRGGGSIPITQTQYSAQQHSRDYYIYRFFYFVKLDPTEDYGIFVFTLDSKQLSALGLQSGLFAMYIRPGSKAEKEGFKKGDIIVGLDANKPCNTGSFYESPCQKNNSYSIIRNKKNISLKVKR